MNVFLYVIDTLADWEIGFLTAEINSGRYLKKNIEKPKIIKVGKNLKTVKTMGGLEITPDISVKDIQANEGDLLLLGGADTWLTDENNDILHFVKTNINSKIYIGAICGATIALAQSGLLDDKKHTSNDLGFLKMTCPGYNGEKNYCNEPAVTDNNVITATGIAPLDFSYAVLKKTGIMEKNTAEAWYQLYKTGQSNYFFALMESIQ